MRLPAALRARLVLGIGLVGLVSAACGTAGTPRPAVGPSAPQPSVPEATSPPTIAQADEAFIAGRFAEAAAAYEALLGKRPDDARLAGYAAVALNQLSFQETRAAAANALRARGRALAVRARSLGNDEPILKLLVDETGEDGSLVGAVRVFSLDAETQAAMSEGEAAFARGDVDAAVVAYRRALAREPRNYYATLFVGDAYFAKHDWKPAEEWFRKAIALSPDLETAHRYLGDTLTRLQRPEEARDEYVEAVIADPYGRFAAHRLLEYVQNVREKPPLPGFPVLRVPYDPADPKLELFRRPPLQDYAAAIERGRKAEGRRTLAAEVAALEELSRAEGADPDWTVRISQLALLRREGLLPAYALIQRADDELQQDYAAYRSAHRAELRRFLRRYWCGLE